ncbi:GroES-like protein [Byssothecium circinans]|uniref:GroES-like protein n=1 Tax=Byssothecium circinans TaxID=147558 RepID=A0A6A5TVX8_9PLEO|nr:GroES-like protein [Byssothecium circinans]
MPNTATLPESTKALTYKTPASLPHLTELPLPLPDANQLIKTHHAAINPVDIQLWGNPVLGRLAGKKGKGPGYTCPGAVVAVGDAVKEEKGRKWEVGDEVFGLLNRPTGPGTFAVYITIMPSSAIAKKPGAWSWEEAAAVLLLVLNAFACLNRLHKQNGKGGRGKWGMWCTQLAKMFGSYRWDLLWEERGALAVVKSLE